ncbi:hypothetical protein Adt_46619 [Abeliophyllum distichum]|uniref:Uncharacterized protein n=1 Tax=Abeliophyllum distichum TaxID=126358 RepID=A0ABD1NZ29_9LAMI
MKAWHQLDKAQYQTSSYIGRASANKPLPNKDKLIPQLGLSFCRRVISTQGPSLFMKAWNQLGKAQYQVSSYIGRASANKPLPNKDKLLFSIGTVFSDASSPHKGQASS